MSTVVRRRGKDETPRRALPDLSPLIDDLGPVTADALVAGLPLEELRARAGGIQVTAALPQGAASESDAVRRLQEARELLEAKLITDAEYEAIKAKIVSS